MKSKQEKIERNKNGERVHWNFHTFDCRRVSDFTKFLQFIKTRFNLTFAIWRIFTNDMLIQGLKTHYFVLTEFCSKLTFETWRQNRIHQILHLFCYMQDCQFSKANPMTSFYKFYTWPEYTKITLAKFKILKKEC